MQTISYISDGKTEKLNRACSKTLQILSKERQ